MVSKCNARNKVNNNKGGQVYNAGLNIGGTKFNADPLLGMIRYWRRY